MKVRLQVRNDWSAHTFDVMLHSQGDWPQLVPGRAGKLRMLAGVY